MVSYQYLIVMVPLRDISFRNLSNLDFDFSRSLKVESDDAIGLAIYGCLLMGN